jgi:imidazolonepropionase
MARLILANARILTLASKSPGARRGAAMRDLGVIERGFVVVNGDRIETVSAGDPPAYYGDEYDVEGRVVMPAFTDCHTHACFAGERYAEVAMRLAGTPYLDILAAGGGIMSTVRATRAAATDELVEHIRARLRQMRTTGTAHVEIKSGYGLEQAAEFRMLDAIEEVARHDLGLVRPTFLGAHAIDGDEAAYTRQVIDAMLPAMVARYGPITCDAYCEKGAWSRADARRLFERAKALGCPLRVHVDQFNELGFLDDALELGARTVDHLEATSDAALARIARSDAIGVLLPGAGLTLDLRFANGRRLIDEGGAVAIATNLNPGSSPLTSMPLVIALAARFCRLTHEEAITAACWNSACAMGIERHAGSIEPGKRADLVILPSGDERSLAYEWGAATPISTYIGGELLDCSDIWC